MSISELLLGEILTMKNFIIGTVLFFIAMDVFCLLFLRRFSWRRINRAAYGWVMNRSSGDQLWMAACILQMLFVLIETLTAVAVGPEAICMLLFFAVLKFVAMGRAGVLVRDIINSGLMFAMMVVANVLEGYLKETRFHPVVVLVLVLIAIFQTAYVLWFFLKDLGVLYEEKKKKARRSLRVPAGILRRAKRGKEATEDAGEPDKIQE